MGSPVLRPNAEARGARAANPKGEQKGGDRRGPRQGQQSKGSSPKGKGRGTRRSRRAGQWARADPNDPDLLVPRGAGAARAAGAPRQPAPNEIEGHDAGAAEARVRSPPPRLQSPAPVRPRLRPPSNPLLVGPPSPGGTRRVQFAPREASPSPGGRARVTLRPGSPHPGAQRRGVALRPRAAEAPASPQRGGGEAECPAQ